MFPDTRYQAKAWYSFSQPDYKYINSPRCNRITEKGFWKITGKPRDISSTHVTCKKRTLTFYKGRVSKSERTGWVMHEYYFTKPKQGSNTSQGRDPLRDFVLYRLKKKPANSMSDNKNLQDTLIGDDLTDPGNGSCIASSSGNDQAATAAALNHDMTPAAEELLAYQELEDDLFDSGNHDRGEPGGGISSDSTDQVLRDMIQQWKSCAPVGEYLNSLLTLPESPQPPQPPQPPQLGNAPDVCSDEFVDPSTGGCITCNTDNQDAAMNHMISAEEEILAYKQLERALLGNGDHDDGEPGSGGSSDFNDQAVDDMILELSAELQKDSDSPFPPPEPSQTIQPHQLGDAADVHSGKFSNCPSPTNYDNESVINIVYNSQNRATSERISEAYSQPEENRGSPFQRFDQLQNYTLQSCAPAVEYLNSLFPRPQSPQPHQPPQLGNAPDVCSDESIDPGTGGCMTYNTDNQAAAMNHVISDTEEILTYKQLELAVLGNGNHGDGEPSSGISSYFIDQALNDMILEFPAGLQKDLDSPFPPPEPPQTHQPHQLGDVPDAHIGEFSNCPSPIGDNGFYLTNKNNIATNYDNEQVINITHNSPNCATNERISEAYSQPEENRGSPFQLFHQLHNYPLPSPILFSELGELLLANTCIGHNESQSFNMEPATLFPQSS
ncbi:uncharacterized protein LOC126629842 isoform X4 [Malus sylvestris]|nr:uncharacterized protein LOC126629842 isoform X4 [Malus sylvestris]